MIERVGELLQAAPSLPLRNVTQGRRLKVKHDMSEREVRIVQAGGMLNYIREGGK